MSFKPIKDEFVKELNKALRIAARDTGKEIVKQRLASFGKVSSRRKKAVRSFVSKKNFTMIVSDYAPLAMAQETGQVIRPTAAKYLKIPVGSRTIGQNNPKFTKMDSRGKLNLFERVTKDKINLVAVLRKEVRISKMQNGLGDIAKSEFPKYLKRIDDNLFK